MKATFVDVTPDLAREWLKDNDHNRPLVKSRIAHLAAEMSSGKWAANGATIVRTSAGKLLDGQHRLHAIIQYGNPIQMLVVEDAGFNTFATIDTGRSRTGGDVLSLHGLKRSVTAAAAAGLLWRMFHAERINCRVPPPYLVDIVDRYPGIEKWSQRLANVGAGKRQICPNGVMVAILTYLDDIAEKPSLAEAFFDGVLNGDNLQIGSPILALRNRLISMRVRNLPVSAATTWELMIQTVDALESRKQVQRYIVKPINAGRTLVPDLFYEHAKRLRKPMLLADLLAPVEVK